MTVIFFRYARTHIRNSVLSRHSRVRKWVPVTIKEMKGFLAVILNMGLVRKPTIPDTGTRVTLVN